MHTVSSNMTSCTCTFNNQYGLPCRHIFAVRFELNEKLFDTSCVQERWLKSGFVQTSAQVLQNVMKRVTVCKTAKAKAHLDTVGARYKYVLAYLTELSKAAANTIAECSPGEFHEKLRVPKFLS